MNDEILTEELLQELLSRPKVDTFVEKNDLTDFSLPEILSKFLTEKNLTRKDVIAKTNLNQTHAYQIFSGQRNASRNKILQLAIAMNLNLKQTNKLLHAAGVSNLYCKNRRDAIIIFCIDKNFSLQKVDELLFEFCEETISDK